jgi:hypothetical protein
MQEYQYAIQQQEPFVNRKSLKNLARNRDPHLRSQSRNAFLASLQSRNTAR